MQDRRMSKDGVEFLIGWRDFPNIKYDTWEPITNLPGSEHMIAVQEFPRLSRMVRRLLDTTLIDVMWIKQTPWTQQS